MTIPQQVAVADVKKAINLFRKTGVMILGVVESIAYFSCVYAEEKIPLFGTDGGLALSETPASRCSPHCRWTFESGKEGTMGAVDAGSSGL